jgi:hypothetical protein
MQTMKEYMKAAPNYSGTGGRQTRWDQEEEKEDEPYNPEDPVVSDDEEQRPPPLPRSLVQRGAAAAQAAGSIQINLASQQMMSKRSGITNQVGSRSRILGRFREGIIFIFFEVLIP